MQKPCLLLDIDGVISLFGFDHARPPAGNWLLVDGIPHLLSATAAGLIGRLAQRFELVWCSGWEEKADEVLPGALGLPRGLSHLSFPSADSAGRHWKLAAIDAYAGLQRPLAWVDDAHDATCEAWARDRPGPTKLVATEPAIGLTAADVEDLLRWRADLD